MSASDISREAFVGITTLACGGYLKALRTRRLVHVSGWRKTGKGFVTPLFSLGDRPDLPRPEFKDEDRDSVGMNLIVAALERVGMMTYLEAAKATGLSSNTIKNTRYMDIPVSYTHLKVLLNLNHIETCFQHRHQSRQRYRILVIRGLQSISEAKPERNQ